MIHHMRQSVFIDKPSMDSCRLTLVMQFITAQYNCYYENVMTSQLIYLKEDILNDVINFSKGEKLIETSQ